MRIQITIRKMKTMNMKKTKKVWIDLFINNNWIYFKTGKQQKIQNEEEQQKPNATINNITTTTIAQNENSIQEKQVEISSQQYKSQIQRLEEQVVLQQKFVFELQPQLQLLQKTIEELQQQLELKQKIEQQLQQNNIEQQKQIVQYQQQKKKFTFGLCSNKYFSNNLMFCKLFYSLRVLIFIFSILFHRYPRWFTE